jgi:hypothetical protein
MKRPQGANNARFAAYKKLTVGYGGFTTTLTASPAFAKENGKAKHKTREKTEAIGKNGREEGERPYGLERYKEKNGELPSGLEKKKDDERQLPGGLETGGKRVNSTGKTAKSRK